MIEINLMPRSATRRGRRSESSADGSRSRTASAWHLGATVPGLVSLLVLALLHPGARDRHRALEDRLAGAVRDSTELAGLIATAEQLRAGHDSIAARMGVIQELDRGRYVWPHILHQVAVAVPEFTWLTRIAEAGAEDELYVEIEGRTANTFALTRFMNRLEASPFLTSVSLAGTQQISERLPGGGERILSSFVLSVAYQPMPGVPLGQPKPGTNARDSAAPGGLP